MKKNFCLFALLLAFSVSVFAEVELSGEFQGGITNAFTEENSSQAFKAEINIAADIDEFTSVSIELDSEGVSDYDDDGIWVDEDWTDGNVGLDDIRLTTDLTGYFGIEAFDLTFTTGYFDTYYCNWNAVSRSGDEYYLGDADDYLWSAGPTTDLAFEVQLGIGDYSAQYWMDYAASAFMFAVSGNPADEFSFLAGYYAETTTLDEGNIWVETNLSLDAGSAKLSVPVAFAYELTDDSWGWGTGIAADLVEETVRLASGISGNSENSLETLNAEISTTSIENTDIYAIADMDLSESTVFQSIDLGGIYDLGKLGVSAGYVVATSDTVETSVYGGTSTVTGNGMYFFFDLDF